MSQDTSRSFHTSHASGSCSIQTEILNFPINHILQVSCDSILCCDWYTLHGAGWQVALWPYPRPFSSVQNRVWPCETMLAEPPCSAEAMYVRFIAWLSWVHTMQWTCDGKVFHTFTGNYSSIISCPENKGCGEGISYLFLKHQKSVLNRVIAIPSGVQEIAETTSGLRVDTRWV